jgi:glutamate-1-semialdehyde 2,1-aminomutase
MIFSLDYTEAAYEAVADRIEAAALEMRADGWWSGPELSNKEIKRRVFREMWQG